MTIELEDRTIWPDPTDTRLQDAAWAARYATPTRNQLFALAEVVSAYSDLITHPAFTLRRVSQIVSEMRKQIRTRENET